MSLGLEYIISIDETTFIARFINNSLLVPKTKLDNNIKAIINNYRYKEDRLSINIVSYLNKLRIVYFLSRLKYYNKEAFNKLNSKYYIS